VLVLPVLFVGVSYGLIGLSGGIAKPLMYLLCVCGTAASAGGICLLCLCLSGSLAAGISTSSVTLTVLLMFSGFLRPREAMPTELQWIVDISPFSHSFAAMMANEMGGSTTIFDASGYDNVELRGDVWLTQFDIDAGDLTVHARALAAISFAIWALAFIFLWLRSRYGGAVPRCRSAVRVGLHKEPPAAERKEFALPQTSPASVAAGEVLSSGQELAWQGLSRKLPHGPFVFEGLAGRATRGRPLALLGPSGCGKSSLLSILAGEDSGVRDGTVFLDGTALAPRSLRRVVGYVSQDDALPATLTVREAIAFSAALSATPSSAPVACAAERVEWALRRLGLEAVAKSRIGGERGRGISGGERRRVAIGVELVSARGVLILDEPTSGLDASGALQLGRLLSELAVEGRVVVASLHQPSAELLRSFVVDALVLAPGGRVAFLGPLKGLEDHVNLHCGPLRFGSPSDRMLDFIATSEGAEAASQAYCDSAAQRQLMLYLEETAAAASSRPPPSLAALPPLPTQLWQLVLRELRIAVRDKNLVFYHYVSALVAGLLLGFTYRALPLNLSGVISRIGLFFALQCILGMQALQGLTAWREGHVAFLRERGAGCYGTGVYVLAKVIVDGALLRVGPPVLLGSILYPLAVLQEGREGLYFLALCLASLASSALCLALGALAPRSGAVLPMAVLVLLAYLLFGGIMLNDPPPLLEHLSYFRESYHLLVANELEGLSFRFDPKGMAKAFKDLPGSEWLQLLHIDAAADAPRQLGLLFGWVAAYTLLAWAALSRSR